VAGEVRTDVLTVLRPTGKRTRQITQLYFLPCAAFVSRTLLVPWLVSFGTTYTHFRLTDVVRRTEPFVPQLQDTLYKACRKSSEHLILTHEYRIVCSYCGSFQCKLRYMQLFREHLCSKHPDVVRNDPLFLDLPEATFHQLRVLLSGTVPHAC
jgi:hypothetical protein